VRFLPTQMLKLGGVSGRTAPPNERFEQFYTERGSGLSNACKKNRRVPNSSGPEAVL
jgi:hypothetical protein